MKVICLYCNKEFNSINRIHLKTHGKTALDLKTDFPSYQIDNITLLSAPSKSDEERNLIGYRNDRKVKGYSKNRDTWNHKG